MNINLKLKLESYKNITLQTIESIENEDFDLVDELIIKRQEMINNISLLSYTKAEFKFIADQLKLLTLDERLNILLSQKKIAIRDEINKINSSKSANKTYNKNLYSNSTIFSKKV